MTIKKISKFISLVALYLVPIFPLIVASTYFFPFITGKAFYFRILVEIAFASWLLLAFLDAKYRPRFNAITIVVTVFALIALVADLLGVNPLRSIWSNFERMEGWITIIHLWAFFIVSSNIFGFGEEGKVNWHRWLNAELFVAFIVGCYGIAQLYFGADIHQGSSRIDASLGNAAYMAVYLLWNVGVASYMFILARAKRIANSEFMVWVYPVLAVFFGFLLLETETRGTILGLVGGTVVALLSYAIFARGNVKTSRWITGGLVGLFVVLGIIFWTMRTSPIIQNNHIASRLANISLSNTESTSRLYIWNMAYKGWTERPILGWGQENFNYVFNENYNPKLYNQEQWFDRAHSVYLDWLIASGLLGFLAYISLYVLFLVVVWKSSLSTSMKAVLTGVLVGYGVHNIFVFDNLASYVLFFAALGFVSSFAEGKPFKFLGTKPASSELVEFVVAPALILALVAVLYFFNIRQIQSNTLLIKAIISCNSNPSVAAFQNVLDTGAYVSYQETREQVFSCAGNVIGRQNVPSNLKQDFYNFALKGLNAQIASSKLKDARIYMLGGSFMDSVGKFAEAEPYLKTAHEISPKKQTISMEYGLNLINNGKLDESVKVLKDAYEVEKKNTQAGTLYALALIVNGKEALAHEIFGNDPQIFETVMIAQAYVFAKMPEKAIAIYKKLVAINPKDQDLAKSLAQLQYNNGYKAGALETLRNLEKAVPELTDTIEATIKQAGL